MELAIVCPIFIALLAGVIDFGLMLYQQTVVVTAADAGALDAIAYGYNQTNIQNAVQNSPNGVGFSTVQANPLPSSFCGCPTAAFSITTMSCGNSCPTSGLTAGTYVTVNAQSTYKPIIPWTFLPWSYAMGPGAVTLAARSTVRIQ